jgi:lipopolysaccharide/colanic/teichoic acid biosynthesis glycosyltransferase
MYLLNSPPKKRVAIVVASVLQIKFFLEQHLILLSKEFDVTLIVNNDHPKILEEMVLPVRILTVSIERKIYLQKDVRALFELISIFSDEKFDLVHTMNPKAGLLGMIAAAITRIPTRVHTFQGEVWVGMRGIKRQFFINIDRLIAVLATNLLVVSFSEMRFLIDSHIISPHKSKVLAHGSIGGVDLAKFSPSVQLRKSIRHELLIPDETVLLLYMGRLTREKGIYELGRVFEKIQQELTQPIMLILVGPDEDNIRSYFSTHFSAQMDKVQFFDYTSSPEKYLAAADILVLPSHREGFGVVIIEAAAMGVPAVATNIYGIQDAIVANETGLLFNLGDERDLGDKLKQLILDQDLRQKLGANARSRVINSFDQQQVLQAFLEFYQSMLGKQPSAPRVFSNLTKRIFDIFFGLFILIPLIIPMLCIALLVRLTSQGPAIYWSSRVGVNSVLFQMPKFRSMRVDAPVVATHLLHNPVAHLTSFGKFLRKSSLDELPQIWSILKGDMSFVGPRPALFNQEDLIAGRKALGIDQLKPGLTGWAQVNGRDDIPLEKKMQLDAQYLQRQSFLFDLYVIWLTFLKVLRSEGVAH